MTLTNIARYDKGQVQGEVEITEEGFIKGKAVVTRCGVFLYKNSDGTIRKELRHPDDVLIPESLETIKMIPVVNGHPPERLVNDGNAKRLSVGYTGEYVSEEMPYIIANMVITDKDVVNQIKNKKKNELSLGYTVDLVEEKGLYYGEPYEYRQTNIRYNHLAIVDEARAGPQARISLDGEDAEEIFKEGSKMAATKEKDKKMKKVTIDAEEYMLEDNAAMKMEEMKKAHGDLMKEHMALKDAHEKMMAERDTMRDKESMDPEMVHHPLGEEDNEEEMKEMKEEDEVGPDGKEEMDPVDTYGMESHVKDYEPPSTLKEHVVAAPKNKHYPHDLPHIPKVDAAEVLRKKVKERVKLEKLSEKYLDRASLTRLDSMNDLEIKKRLIKNFQPNADLTGKSEIYINARFDAVIEDTPQAKVIAMPSNYKSDEDEVKDQANAADARKAMIKRQKIAYRGGK